jgi:GlpG protein
MRLIGTLADEQKALTFSLFLHQKGIEHQLEILKNTDWGSPNYGTSQCKIWIVDEENLEEALKWHHLFIENPMDPQFNLLKTEQLPLIRSSHPLSSAPLPIVEEGSNPIIPPGTHPVQTWQDRPMGMITRLIILLCSTLFLASQVFMLNNKVPDNLPFIATLTSPIEKNLLYDFPKTYELLAQFVKVYGVDKLEDPTSMPPEGQKLLKQINQTPTWIGLYNLIEKKGFKSLKHPFQQPMFEKIKQGEVWRIVSPAFLHSGIFHIFFNMLWLIALGKQIEQRLGAFRYILFILIVAALSNTAEYLIS